MPNGRKHKWNFLIILQPNTCCSLPHCQSIRVVLIQRKVKVRPINSQLFFEAWGLTIQPPEVDQKTSYLPASGLQIVKKKLTFANLKKYTLPTFILSLDQGTTS